MKDNVDWEDMVVMPLFFLAAGVSVGLFSFQPFGFDFASTVFSLGSGAAAITFSIAKVLSILSVGTILATNRPDFSTMGVVETWVAFTTIGLILAPPFMPMIEVFIQTNEIVGLVGLAIQSGGAFILGYMG